MLRAAFVILLVSVGGALHSPTLETVSVLGLRLGMRAIDVTTSLRRQHLPSNISMAPCLSDYLRTHKKAVPIVGPGKCVQSIVSIAKGRTILALFSEDLPSNPNVSTLAMLQVSPVNAADLKRALFPTMSISAAKHISGEGLLWCFSRCERPEKVFTDVKAGEFLSYRHNTVLLSDPRSADERHTTEVSLLADHGVHLIP